MKKQITRNRKPIDPGTRFGRWTVLRKSGYHRNGQTLYECRCDCGNIKEVRKSSLLLGESKSCGCVSREKLIGRSSGMVSPRRIDISGQRFGKLVAIEFAYTKNKRTFWKCKCDCGNTVEVDLGSLRSGKTTSCGCIGSKNIEKCIAIQHENELVEKTNLCLLGNKPSISNTTGRRGVSFNRKEQLFVSRICFQGKRYYLGAFKSFEKAVIAREKAEERLYNKILEKYGREQIINPSTQEEENNE